MPPTLTKPVQLLRARASFLRVAMSLLLACCFCTPRLPAQQPTPEELQQWMTAQQWQQVVDRLGPLPHRDAEMEFDYGTALARLQRWPEATAAFKAGQHLAQRDARFSTELAGIAFQQKRYALAAAHLRRAHRLAPDDSYVNDFLGTVYFLEDNLPAAIQAWNRTGKPYVAEVREEPQSRVRPELLDNAFAFSPAATMTMRQYLDSRERIEALGIFPQFQLDLRARADGHFDAVFRGEERNGFGDTRLEAAFLFLRGLPFQEVNPEYDNVRRGAINFTSMVRWDAQKRRILAQLSGPLHRSGTLRYEFLTDLRNENWIVRPSFTGTAPALASLNLRHEWLTADVASYARDRLQWSAGAEISYRDYRNVSAGTTLTQPMLSSGAQLKQVTRVASNLWRIPAHRFTLHADGTSEVARLWSASPQTFAKLRGGIGAQWFPQAKGGDYETVNLLRGGRTFGQAPFDELFMLGLERDNDLPMHAHIGTRDGRKGSAPIGRDYLLENWELNKNLYGNGILSVQAGPILDIGAISDPGTALGSHQWLFDTGVQGKVRVFGEGVALSWGRDLRTGNNAFYATILQRVW